MTVETQVPFCFSALVTVVALSLEKRLHFFEIVDATTGGRLRFLRRFIDPLRNKMIDPVVSFVSLRQFRNAHFFRLGQPLLRRGIPLRPVIAPLFSFFLSGQGIEFRQPLATFLFVFGPPLIGVGHLTRSWREQFPGLAAFRRNGRHRFPQLRSAFALARNTTNKGFKNHKMFASFGFKFDPAFAVPRRREPKVRPEIKILVLFRKIPVTTGIS